MQTENNNKPLIGADNNALIAVVSINLVIAATLGLIRMIYYLEGSTLLQYETEVFQRVVLYPQKIITQPWTIFTFNWVNDGFWVLFTQLFWFAVFANVLQHKASNKHIFPIYFYTGLVTALIYCLIGTTAPLLGANVGVISVALAAIVIAPKYTLLSNIAGGVQVWVVALFYLVATGYALVGNNWQITTTIILGGFTGAVYMKLIKKGIDLGSWMHQLIQRLNNSLTPKK